MCVCVCVGCGIHINSWSMPITAHGDGRVGQSVLRGSQGLLLLVTKLSECCLPWGKKKKKRAEYHHAVTHAVR